MCLSPEDWQEKMNTWNNKENYICSVNRILYLSKFTQGKDKWLIFTISLQNKYIDCCYFLCVNVTLCISFVTSKSTFCFSVFYY